MGPWWSQLRTVRRIDCGIIPPGGVPSQARRRVAVVPRGALAGLVARAGAPLVNCHRFFRHNRCRAGTGCCWFLQRKNPTNRLLGNRRDTHFLYLYTICTSFALLRPGTCQPHTPSAMLRLLRPLCSRSPLGRTRFALRLADTSQPRRGHTRSALSSPGTLPHYTQYSASKLERETARFAREYPTRHLQVPVVGRAAGKVSDLRRRVTHLPRNTTGLPCLKAGTLPSTCGTRLGCQRVGEPSGCGAERFSLQSRSTLYPPPIESTLRCTYRCGRSWQ